MHPLPSCCRAIRIIYCVLCLVLLLETVADWSLAEEAPQPPATQIFRASDWKGGTDKAFEGCKANSGEYTLWVYAKGETCGVPREQADRVVMFRQPLPGVSPVRATSQLPGGVYFAWAFGSGDPGHPWINLCAKTCAKGALPAQPGWVFLGSIEVRELHQMWLKSWEQPDGHQLSVQAIVLSASEKQPEWRP
ncbi:MAG TPA: hypothetical protein VKP13_12620 [Nitrospira sp.]|nr:hypothetical protein [Nitrospira sp.]